jgi:hypothetical protein
MPLPLLIPSGIKPKQTHFVIKRDDPTPTTRKGKKKKEPDKRKLLPSLPRRVNVPPSDLSTTATTLYP